MSQENDQSEDTWAPPTYGGPYKKFFEDPECPIPRFNSSVVKGFVRASLSIQGKVGAYNTPSTDSASYLQDVYFARIMTIHQISRPRLGFDAMDCDILLQGVDDDGDAVTLRAPDRDEEFDEMSNLLDEDLVGKRILGVRGVAMPLVEADDVLRELAVDDAFIRRHLPPIVPTMPTIPAEMPFKNFLAHLREVSLSDNFVKPDIRAQAEIGEVMDNLEKHRELRNRQPGQNAITKRMFMRSGRGSTAWKIPITGVTAVHAGSGMYGGLTGIGNEVICVDPLLNGMHIEQLCPQKLNALGLVYISDASAPNEDGTGLGHLAETEEFAIQVNRSLVKNRIDRPIPGHVPVNYGRLHNGDVIWSKGIPTASIDMEAKVREMLTVNHLRGLVHQGIYRAGDGGAYKRHTLNDPYDSVGMDAVRAHMRMQLKTVAFGPIDHIWVSQKDKDRIIAEGLRDVAYDPGQKIPTRATGYCTSASSFKEVLNKVHTWGLSENQAINLLRGLRQERFFKDAHDYKYNKRGATRGWCHMNDDQKFSVAHNLVSLYDGMWMNEQHYETAEE